MGAKCLYKIILDSTTAPVAERELVRRVEAHTGRKTGSWDVQYSQYTASGKRPPLELLYSTETPSRRVAMFGTRVLEAEEVLSTQLQKLAAYAPRVVRSLRGAEYDFVDFRVRVGLIMDRAASGSGVAVEIEYAPCQVVADCAALVTELMDRIAMALVPPPQAGQDSQATKAASTNFRFRRVEVEFDKFLTEESKFFTIRHSMLLYRQLFADLANDK